MWEVVLKPVTEYHPETGKNQSGLLVVLVNEGESHEVKRVAFARRHAKNKTRFKVQLMKEIAEATEIADAMNEHERKWAAQRKREQERLAAEAKRERDEKMRRVPTTAAVV